MAITDVLKGFGVLMLFVIPCCFCFCRLSLAVDSLGPGDAMQYNETLVSENGVFELGFFGTSSGNRYMGIWFKNDPHKKAVWVANREDPILDSFGVLSIRYDGNLVMMDKRLIPIIVNSGMLATASNTTAKLLDSGNLVLRGEKVIIWQSFYYPSDTFLPGMKLGLFNLGTDQKRQQFLVSWESPSAPETGSFVLALDSVNMTDLRVWHGEGFSMRLGFWDGHSFNFLFESPWNKYNVSYVSNPHEAYLTFSSRENYNYSWFVLASTGEIYEYIMIGEGISMVNYSLCQGTSPTNATDCFLVRPLTCPDGDTFSHIQGSLSNSSVITEAIHLDTGDCDLMCQSNCSCIAYLYASSGNHRTGCELYFGDKSSLLHTDGEGTDTIYIRGKTPTKTDYGRKRKYFWLFVLIPLASFIVLVILASICYLKWRYKSCSGRKWNQDSTSSVELLCFQLGTNIADEVDGNNIVEFSRKKDHELPLLSFSCIATATDYFSTANKLGEGGFGPVYKGILLGHEIAVKRLSKRSGQGLEEFKNEVQLISKLQHRNLVSLLGCCIQREEKILVYEYMLNRSLDSFLFDPTKKTLLDWEKRFCIIEGIAQGLLYLHKYSRLRIIHRDLKTSNILLDEHMNPKISDFGMAKIFQEDETRAKTNRVVGTYGYMSPEYAVHGLFSIKSDVFSFGVIVLEIISGKRNTAFYLQEHSLNLLEYAWDLWKDDRGVEFMDPALADTCPRSKLMLCFKVGLLCVQEKPEDRPTMSDIVSMLSNENSNLCSPKRPAFSAHTSHPVSPATRHQSASVNDLTASIVEAR